MVIPFAPVHAPVVQRPTHLNLLQFPAIMSCLIMVLHSLLSTLKLMLTTLASAVAHSFRDEWKSNMMAPPHISGIYLITWSKTDRALYDQRR